ncbi:MAG: hypothetical protein MO846_06685 [Candidatus Devosia symbiotica]|nr:hypothetical protein [Candidatus Devosia symbiotica]
MNQASRGSGQVGHTGQTDANRQIDLCLDAGISLLDIANVYKWRDLQRDGRGRVEQEWPPRGSADRPKVRFKMGDGPNEADCRGTISSSRPKPA